MCSWTKNSLELHTSNSLIIIWLMVSAGNRTEQSSYATLNPERCMARFDPGLRAPPRRAALQCRSQAHPGDRDRDGHTYSRAQAGTESPRQSWDTSPRPLAGNGGGVGPRRGQSQPLRPVSTPMSWQD